MIKKNISKTKRTINKKAANNHDNNKISQKHDSLFRSALENPIVAREFIETHVPAEIKKLIDLGSLKLENDTFVEKNLKKTVCDVLFSATIDGKDGYLFLLLEHQSKPDPWMGLRLMRYMLSICSRYLKQHPKAKSLPLVYPLILFNGKQKYRVPRNLWDLFADPKQAKRLWNEDHHVINVHDIPDEELKQRAWSGILEFFLKHIHERNLINAWERIQSVIPKLLEVKHVGLNYLEMILYYTLTAVEKDDKMKLETILKSYLKEEEEEKLMTSLARHWEEEGIQKGINIGEARGEARGAEKRNLEIAINMLKENADPKFVAKVTGFSLDEILKLKNRL